MKTIILQETEKLLAAIYEYKSKDDIYIDIKGSLEIVDIKIPEELKNSENFNESLINAINEAVLQVKKCTQSELEEILMSFED